MKRKPPTREEAVQALEALACRDAVHVILSPRWGCEIRSADQVQRKAAP